MKQRSFGLVAMAILTLMMSGCVSSQSQLGVKNLWRSGKVPTFKKGKTTEAEVLQVLGPPSQVIGLRDQTVFYYLREQNKTGAYYLLIYNHTNEQITYDRAIFFFDQNGILKESAVSHEAIPYK